MALAPVNAISCGSVELLKPQAGVDYPGTWQAFEEWFGGEEACRRFLAKVRWPDGFVCPVCAAEDAWMTARGLWMCRQCGRQTSVTAGTIFHRSRYPLRVWFAAMWFVCAQKNGVSALGVQRVLGFGSYRTAWTWMHKLRRAMVRPARDRLGGPDVAVEIDQTFVGGRTQGRNGPRYRNKTEVVIAVERLHPKGLGRARLRQIDMTNRKEELFDFTRDSVATGSIVYTDGEGAFCYATERLHLRHEPIIMVASPNPAHETLPAVHRVASLLKRWLAGTLHDAVASDHLDYYLDEFTFRFNRRTSRSRGLMWYRLVQQAVHTDPHPYHQLITTSSGSWS
jgi:ISXO2-like transposase domain/Transposase zinc-ribbon domain